MKNRNEDKFGIIIDEKHQFNSLEAAENYVKGLKDKLKRKASSEEFPVTCAMPEERMKFVEYGLSLMTQENLPFTHLRNIVRCRSVLWLRTHGYTYEAIANYLKKEGFGKVMIKEIKEAEKEGMKLVKRAIDRVKNINIPVLGG